MHTILHFFSFLRNKCPKFDFSYFWPIMGTHRVGQVSGTVGHCRARSGSSWISVCNHFVLSLFAFCVLFYYTSGGFVHFCVVWVPFEWIPCVSTYFLLMFVDSDGKQCFACSWRRVCYLLYVFWPICGWLFVFCRKWAGTHVCSFDFYVFADV